jgi:tetratricopeptide (TPR) repeat protein
MKGVCYRHLGFPLQAVEHFEEVLSHKKRVSTQEQHLLPQSHFELGAIHRKLGNLVEAKKHLKKSRDEYSGYLTEIMIQYRSGHLLKCIKREMEGGA